MMNYLVPSPYVIRSFTENQHYHIFNRGVEQRNIFKNTHDYKMYYKMYMYYLFIYTSSPEKVFSKYPTLPANLKSNNLADKLELVAYCLMPNHIHLLIKQFSSDATSQFMKRITNAYTKFFNTKYKRTGSLMGGRFKAAFIKSDNLLLHVSRYIHLNPVVANLVKNPKDYPWSSYSSFLIGTEGKDEGLCKTKNILGHFPHSKSYQKFVLDQIGYAKELDKIKHLAIDAGS